LALAASDDHNDNALRFTALWLQHSDDQPSNDAVAKHLSKVPSRKFAPLMNQLTSRLQDIPSAFQTLLYELVRRICQEHPYHGVYQIYASSKSKPEGKDEAAVSRQRTAEKLSSELKSTPVGTFWQSIYESNDRYCNLAAEKDESYRSGKKYSVAQSRHASRLSKFLSTHKIPPPTMNISLAADLDYSRVPRMVKLDSTFSIASGVSAPKILTVYAENGQRYKQLVRHFQSWVVLY
jgi:ataxia telangiectasia mutated family protein